MLSTCSLLYITVFFSHIKPYKQTLKCLIKAYKKETFFINLTFDCNKTRLKTAGCLSKVSVDYFYYSLIYKHLTLHPDFVKNPQDNQVIYYPNIDIFAVENKNKYKRNEKRIEFKNANSKKIVVGVPLPIENTLLHSFRLKYGHFNADENDFPLVNINYMLPLSYKVKDYRITELQMENDQAQIIMCKDITSSIYNESSKNPFILFRSIRKWVSDKIINRYDNYAIFERYEKLRNNSTITKDELKSSTVVFFDRIDKNKITPNDDLRNLRVYSNLEESLMVLLKYNNMLFTFTDFNGTNSIDAAINSDYMFHSLYHLRKINRKGSKVRRNSK